MSPVDVGHTRSKGRKQRQNGASDVYGQILRRINSTHQIDRNDIIQLYHLDKPLCQGCRGNSKDSPNCFCGLVPPPNGNRKQGLWQKLSDTLDELGPDPSESLRAPKNSPSGLTNLGATCYVNSVLQCLYMNTAFRKGVFAAEVDFVRKQPVLHQLCRLFAQLHSGIKVAVDSAPFANTLELDNAVQQDGQEFLKLLLTLLEGVLGLSRNPRARNVVQNVFRGTFSYVTKCCKCGQESDASKDAVDFYELELNVKGFSSLDESLNDYLSEENLQGENQYMCESCKTRVDATHSTKLRSLPPVLNFQLKRFVFNAKTATKKKVTSKFSFPRSLDMGPRLSAQSVGRGGDATHSAVYDLAAILVHKGSMVNSGHYVAHIKDEQTGEWWQFDDEKVSSLGYHPLGEASGAVSSKETSPGDAEQLTRQLDINREGSGEEQVPFFLGAEPSPTAETSKSLVLNDLDVLTSADAYMLMYSRREQEVGHWDNVNFSDSGSVHSMDSIDMDRRPTPVPDFSLPDQFRIEVEEMNREFDNMCREYRERREKQESKITERRAEVRKVLAEAPVKKLEDPFFWISVDWLRSWADTVEQPPAIHNASLLCQHQKVSPRKITLMKRISESAWRYLYSKYQGGPVLSGNDHCVDCIFEDAKVAASADSYRDQRAYMRELVDNVLSGRGGHDGKQYYVSRTWLTQWQRRKAADAPSEADAGPTAGLRCPHGGLLPEQATGAKRQLVPERAWEYFHQNAVQVEGADPRGHSPFREDTVSCKICQSEIDKVASKREGLRATKFEQRAKHEALYAGKTAVVSPGAVYYLVPSVWLNRWRAYLGASGKNVLAVDEPDGLEGFILSLLCPKHEGMLFKPPTLIRTRRGDLTQRTGNDDIFTVVTEDDWMGLCHQWDVDSQRGIKACLEIGSEVNHKGAVAVSENYPAINDCNGSKGGLRDMAVGDSDAGGVFSDDTECRPEVVPVLQTQPEVCRECIEEREVHELLSKLHYTCGEISVDLVRGKGPPPSLLAASGVLESERRTSKRARRASATSGGRVLLKVSGETTVFQLKLQIWESLAIIRENQKVHFGKTELLDDSATLADLNILPGSQLWVMDTGQHENRDIAEELPAAELGRAETEEGFRGTRLVMGLPSILESLSACMQQQVPPPLPSRDSSGEDTFVLAKDVEAIYSTPLADGLKAQGAADGAEQGGAVDGARHSETEDVIMSERRDSEGNLPVVKSKGMKRGTPVFPRVAERRASPSTSSRNGVEPPVCQTVAEQRTSSVSVVNNKTAGVREPTTCISAKDKQFLSEDDIDVKCVCVAETSTPSVLLQLQQTYDIEMEERSEDGDHRPTQKDNPQEVF